MSQTAVAAKAERRDLAHEVTAIVATSPALFAPECPTPEQMRLANAFCRLREVTGGNLKLRCSRAGEDQPTVTASRASGFFSASSSSLSDAPSGFRLPCSHA